MKLIVDMETALSRINLAGHFLLRVRDLTATIITGKGEVKLTVVAPSHTRFEIDLTAAESGTMTVIFTLMTLLKANHGGRFYPCLRVVQRFAHRSTKENQGKPAVVAPVVWQPTDMDVDYNPVNTQSWSLGLHPSASWNADENRFGIDCTMLDITRHWAASRIKNAHYINMRNNLNPAMKFRVLACLVDLPMIWYVLHPARPIDVSKKVVPHVYFSPDDFAEMQPDANNERYFNDDQYAAGSTPRTRYSREDGQRLEQYFSVPTADENLEQWLGSRAWNTTPRPQSYAELRRNVNVLNSDGTLSFWNAPLGFGKALASSARQVFFMPQRIQGQGGSGKATSGELPKIYTAAIRLFEASTSVFGPSPRDRVQLGKLVLSCYSDSGLSMWAACKVERIKEQLGAIICMEPMGVKAGEIAGVLAGLRQRDVKIHYIGRWKEQGNQFFLNDAKRKSVTKLYPEDAAFGATYTLPPDEATANPYVRFRTRRFAFPDEDPSLKRDPKRPISLERQTLDGLVSRLKTPGDTKSLFKLLFEKTNLDSYKHNLAVGGGQVYAIGQPPFYGKKLEYKTFFQEAVEAIDKSLP